MAKYSQISDRAAESRLLKGLPFARFQYVDVTFPASAYQDVAIAHTLESDAVVVLPVRWSFRSFPAEAPVIYKDTGPGAKAWTSSTCFIRCNLANAQVRLLLGVEAP